MTMLARLVVAWAALQMLCPVAAQTLPKVDLGYTIQQATEYNSEYNAYAFLDIRFAAPPTLANRFRAPQPPATNRTVQTGGQRYTCAQATPGDGQSEDCLFLDVYTPKSAFNEAGRFTGLPVIVWIFGGGYVSGSKNDYTPEGLFEREMATGESGILYVAINYRLGAFGWLSGTEVVKNGNANAGLLDQRFALEWVQKNIAKFGGNPNNVTVMGESAGAGSILHQITAYGGTNGSVPFIRALPQSIGFLPTDDVSLMNQVFQHFLQLLGVSTIKQARTLSFDTLHSASSLQISQSPSGQFTYGPVVDGTFVPDLPGKLFQQGRFHKNVSVMVGHNSNEGYIFTDPDISTNADFVTAVNSTIPLHLRTPSHLNYITNTLYPPIFDGSQAQHYTTEFTRADAFISELIFNCNAFYLDKAFQNQTYAYYFAVPPGTHASDLNYTYYAGPSTSSDPQQKLAIEMQNYFLNFVASGNPNHGFNVPNFPIYGPGATARVFNTSGELTIQDPAANYRCNWWQANL